MAKSKSIRVTPNVLRCLEELKLAARSLPDGELKRRATAALDYLDRTFSGEPQPRKGISCPVDTAIIK